MEQLYKDKKGILIVLLLTTILLLQVKEDSLSTKRTTVYSTEATKTERKPVNSRCMLSGPGSRL